MIDPSELLAALAAARKDEIVVFTMSASKDWAHLSPEGLDFMVAGAMGYASSVGLGLALAQPSRKVIVLDGDGSLLMRLGCLVSTAGIAAPNLVHLVLENGLYEVPGGIPLPGVGKYSLAAIARAAGIPKVYHFDELADFRSALPAVLDERGPIFASCAVGRSAPVPFPFLPGLTMARRLEQALRQGAESAPSAPGLVPGTA